MIDWLLHLLIELITAGTSGSIAGDGPHPLPPPPGPGGTNP
jgi:hypothetical protein